MKFKIIVVGIMIVLIHTSLVFAKQELMLSKEQLFDTGPAIDDRNRDCEALFYVDSGKDIADMRRDFRNYFCEGKDLDRLETLREGLRHKMQQSPLTHATRFTRSLESVYRMIWKKWCKTQQQVTSSK